MFPELSAMEHVEMTAAFKGIAASQIQQQANEILELVGLTSADKAKFTKDLSGGQKRKLQVALAFLGNPRWVSWVEAVWYDGACIC